MALTDKLSAIADAIRGKTGGTEKLSLEGMATAIASIETGGGSGGGASGIYMAKITPAEDMGGLTITHNLGTTDILLAAAWAETLGDIVPTNPNTLAKFMAKSDIPTHREGGNFGVGYTWSVANSYASPQSPNTASYEMLKKENENTVYIPRGQSGSAGYYLAGVTYTVIIMAASAFSDMGV